MVMPAGVLAVVTASTHPGERQKEQDLRSLSRAQPVMPPYRYLPHAVSRSSLRNGLMSRDTASRRRRSLSWVRRFLVSGSAHPLDLLWRQAYLRFNGHVLNRKKTAEKRPIATQRKPEILRRYALFAIPLPLKFRPFIRECFRQTLHRPRDRTIRLLHCAAGFIDKAALDRIPTSAKLLRFVGRKERCRLLIRGHSGCSSRSSGAVLTEGRRTDVRNLSLLFCFRWPQLKVFLQRRSLAGVSQSRCRQSRISLPVFFRMFFVHEIASILSSTCSQRSACFFCVILELKMQPSLEASLAR